MPTTKQTSARGRLDKNDLLKGLLMAVGTAIATALYDTLNAGSLSFDWKKIGIAGGLAGLVYLMKNLFTPAQTIVKLLLPLLLLSCACNAQYKFTQPMKKVNVGRPAYFKALTAPKDSSVTAIRPVVIAAAYGYEGGSNTSMLMAGSGAGIKRLSYDYETQKWKSVYSFNLMLWAAGNVAPGPQVPAFAAGPTIGLLNDNLMVGGAYDFTNRHAIFIVSFSLPTNN